MTHNQGDNPKHLLKAKQMFPPEILTFHRWGCWVQRSSPQTTPNNLSWTQPVGSRSQIQVLGRGGKLMGCDSLYLWIFWGEGKPWVLLDMNTRNIQSRGSQRQLSTSNKCTKGERRRHGRPAPLSEIDIRRTAAVKRVEETL